MTIVGLSVWEERYQRNSQPPPGLHQIRSVEHAIVQLSGCDVDDYCIGWHCPLVRLPVECSHPHAMVLRYVCDRSSGMPSPLFVCAYTAVPDLRYVLGNQPCHRKGADLVRIGPPLHVACVLKHMVPGASESGWLRLTSGYCLWWVPCLLCCAQGGAPRLSFAAASGLVAHCALSTPALTSITCSVSLICIIE